MLTIQFCAPGILLVQDGIEDRLSRQSRRELAMAAGRNECQFLRSYRAIQYCHFRIHFNKCFIYTIHT